MKYLKDKYNKLLCYLFDHSWKYNFPPRSIPNKCICERCKIKAQLNYNNLEFEPVDEFKNETRTDEQLIKQWFS